jgi:hypothetical protein
MIQSIQLFFLFSTLSLHLHPYKQTHMKKLLIILAAGLAVMACNTADNRTQAEKDRDKFVQDSLAAEKKKLILQDSTNVTTLQWLDTTFLDMGKVKEGTTVEVTFRFKNTGTKPLVITNVSASCGCTIPEKPEEPITPGEEGVIKAKFDSKGRPGVNTKEVYVTANTQPASYNLSFKVEVTQ